MREMSLSPEEWEKSAPDDKSIMQLYSEYKFMKNGTVYFELKKPDHTVIESTVYQREDKTNRQNRG